MPKRNRPGNFSDWRGNLTKKRRVGSVFEERGVMANAHYKYFLENLVFRLVAILKSNNKVSKNQRQRNPTCKEISILENCSVSMSKFFEINILKELLFLVYHTPGYICMVLNKSLLKSLISAWINHILETPCLIAWYLIR